MNWPAISSFLLAAAVALGAFGAHGLKARLGAELPIYEKAVFYHFIHALGMLLLCLSGAAHKIPQSKVSLLCLILCAGIIFFSGSLYLLAITKTRWLGMITPLGGTAFIVAWIYLGIALLRKP